MFECTFYPRAKKTKSKNAPKEIFKIQNFLRITSPIPYATAHPQVRMRSLSHIRLLMRLAGCARGEIDASGLKCLSALLAQLSSLKERSQVK